jgi:hypothetical protein
MITPFIMGYKDAIAADSDQLSVILSTEPAASAPAVIAARGPHVGRQFVEFFTANLSGRIAIEKCAKTSCSGK